MSASPAVPSSTSQALRQLGAETVSLHGHSFFEALVRELCQLLGMRSGIVARLDEAGSEPWAHSLAVWHADAAHSALSYALAGTPCRHVADGSVCHHADGVQQAYPDDALLVELGAQSYLGLPLLDAEGRAMGLLAMLDAAPIPWERRMLALELMQAIASRCSAELRALQAHELHQQQLRLHGERELLSTARLIEQERLAALGALVAGMSHDVASPVGVAVTACSGLEAFAHELKTGLAQGALSADAAGELVQRVLDASQLATTQLRRAADLLAGFKTYASDQASAAVSSVDLVDYLRNIVRVHNALLRMSRVKLELDLPTTLPAVLAVGLFSQLVAKLLRNACEHAYEGVAERRLLLKLETRDGLALLLVRDNGRGLPAALRRQLEAPDAQMDAHAPGLGLHLLGQQCRMLHGQLGLEPASAQPGTGFIISIPLNPPEQG